jgi:hypothetical protein
MGGDCRILKEKADQILGFLSGAFLEKRFVVAVLQDPLTGLQQIQCLATERFP